MKSNADAIIDNINKVLVGKSETVNFAVMTFLAGGHLLLEDVPGVGKTTLAKSLARTIDCGFTRLPVRDEMDTIFLEQDRLLVVLPEGHPLTELQKIPVSALCEEPFMLLEKGAKAEVSEIFERSNLKPKVHFTTWDDYAIMAMVESGLGISVLPELILKRIPDRIVTRELEIPAYRNIGLAMRNRKGATPAVKRFLEYLQYR